VAVSIVSTRAAAFAICGLLAIAVVPVALSESSGANSWAAAASMATARAHMTATPLADGRVLVVGGVGETSTELYDLAGGTWSAGGALNVPRWLHRAVRLADGRVLVAGGGAYTASAELYDPATNRWTPTGSMSVDRYDFTATLLRDGRVLVVGGFSGNGTGVQASAELFDPSTTGRWTSTGSLRTPRRNHTATLLRDGTVLVAGGFGDGWLREAELYDPARGRWKRVAPMTIPREHASATLLRDGRVLIAGGGSPSATLSAELYDPASGRWTPTGRMTDYHGSEAVALPDGRVLVAGGGDAGDVYSPASGTWTATGPRAYPLVGGAALAPLTDGRVIGVGGERLANCSPKGCGSEPVAAAELYTP
jgi:Galactose oxidase, central domain/Kelch motif